MSAPSFVFLCPGQGAQTVGMGRGLYDAYPAARDMIDTADALGGFGLKRLMFDGPADELTLTLNAQPALFVLDVVCGRLLLSAGIPMSAAAGHSLGEYAACVLAGAMSFEDGFRLTRLRGELMHGAGGERPGTMAAVMGLDETVIDETLAAVSAGSAGVVVAANLNTPGQIVISGDVDLMPTATERLLEVGAKRVIPLPVSGAFHSPLMEPAAEGLERALERVEIRDPDVPVVANVSAEPLHSSDAIRTALGRQLTGRVRWEDSMRSLLSAGHERFVEVGPGTALRGMMRKIDRTAVVAGVDDPQSLLAFLDANGLAGGAAEGSEGAAGPGPAKK